MKAVISRVSFSLASLCLIAGGILHALAFPGAAAAVNVLPRFLAQSFKALWLIDSITLTTLGAACGYLALRPRSVVAALIFLLTTLPLFTAAMVYAFVGPFFAPHLLVACSILAFAGGYLMFRASTKGVPSGH